MCYRLLTLYLSLETLTCMLLVCFKNNYHRELFCGLQCSQMEQERDVCMRACVCVSILKAINNYWHDAE